jgi:class 3 adenylate cyclase
MSGDPVSVVSDVAGNTATLAHVLFMDIVNSTGANAEAQLGIIRQLREVVRATEQYREANASQQLLAVDTGDGMALIFRTSFEAPIVCAIEIALCLKTKHSCKVRMGIHTGPVYFNHDINGRLNVVGPGINLAERVMSCGAGDHILLSANAAEPLYPLARWREKLVYLGEFRAKKDRVSIWNYADEEVGSTGPLPARPWRVPARRRFLWSATAACVAAPAAYWMWRDQIWRRERSFIYSLIIRERTGESHEVSTDAIVPPGASIKIKFASRQDGHFYLLAEEGAAWTWLFPEPIYQNGSSEVQANAVVTVPTPPERFIELSRSSERGIVHVLWCGDPNQELENIKKSLFSRTSDELAPAEQSVARVVLRLAYEAVRETRSRTNTVVAGRANLLASQFTLGHM